MLPTTPARLRHPRFHLHFTPARSSWLNLVADIRKWINQWFAHFLPKSA